MRLRGKMRILQNAYLQCGDIADRDADVVFVCADGKVRSHKVVLVTASPFFNDLFHGQVRRCPIPCAVSVVLFY